MVIVGEGKEICRQEMGDSNFEQTILIPEDKWEENQTLRVEIPRACDLFGRVIMYKFEVLS